MMKKLIATLLTSLALGAGLVPGAQASGGGIEWDKFPKEKMTDMASLQNGAKLFVNYCLNCHSAAFMRYNRLQDLGLTELQIKSNLMFAGDKVGDLMKVSLDPKQAKEWFGANPPDLTVIARSRAGHGGTGADYLYTFLRSFYRDEAKATGWNNALFPNVAMPHPLWQLQGERRAVFDETTHAFKGYEQITPGTMSQQDYDTAIADLVGYMQWMGEPAQGTRVRLGIWVLGFLFVMTFLAWKLNAAFWKDVK